MNTAVTDKGRQVIASEEAPESATCPYCGSPVTLRKRRSMSGEVTYFWRHRSGFGPSCRGRFSPFRSSSRNGRSSKQDG